MLITRWQELWPNDSFGLPHRKSFLHNALAKGTSPVQKRLTPTMKLSFFNNPPWIVSLVCCLSMMAAACRKKEVDKADDGVPPPVVADELGRNRIGAMPGVVSQSQADSPIHWQPWSKETMERAREARRLLFCVVALPQQPGFVKVLEELAADPATVAAINQNYVPVLVDGDATRELGLLTAELCMEIKRPLNLPLFLWMTHEGNPVAWIPAPPTQGGNVIGLFNQSHTMVSQMWQDSWQYVLKNSAMDNVNRRKRYEQRKISRVTSNQPATDAVRSVRQLASLYDPYSRSFDETGGLFPSSALELLAVASVHPGLPDDVRRQSAQTTRDLLTDLLPSAMFDPLDGGVFLFRRGPTWALPSFSRDCAGEARVATAVLEAYRVTHNPRALELALGVIAFAEKNFQTSDGLFALGLVSSSVPEKWMWTVEDVEKILPAEDARWWIRETGMKGLGNLPSEADAHRDFFRCNTIAFAKSVKEIAATEGVSVEAFQPRFDAAKAKLLAVRDARLGKSPIDQQAHIGSSLRMVSAYAAAFCATGDEAFRGKACELLSKVRTSFGRGALLRSFTVEAPDAVAAGRAFTYALALQATLDVAAITMDEQWLIWSEDLATTATELFTHQAFLDECPKEAKIMDLPVTDLVMLFDDSTAGLVSTAEFRLAEIGRPLVPSFSELATPMPTYILERPVLHTDLLLATLGRHYKLSVVIGEKVSPELLRAVERLSLRIITRRVARADDAVPAGAVKVLRADGNSRVVTDVEALQQAILPNPEK